MQEIKKLWKEFYEKPFPEGYGGIEVQGVELALLDSYTAGCVATFVANKGRLDPNRISILKRCAKELDIVVINREGDAKTYFEHLRLLAKQVLKHVS